MRTKCVTRISVAFIKADLPLSLFSAQGYLGPAGAPYLSSAMPQVPAAHPYSLPSDQPGPLHSLPPNVSANSQAAQAPYMR